MKNTLGASPLATGLAGAEAPEPPSRLGPSDGIPSALVRLSYEIGYLGDDSEFGFSGAKVGHVRDLMRFAHRAYDWQPIETAPKDGQRFLTFSREGGTYDFAQYDTRNGEFCKDGCGWDYASLWATIGGADHA